ncbi:MAG: translocation/assembly module TamB domain-containing protein [Candidatus Thiodiazotropha sp.]
MNRDAVKRFATYLSLTILVFLLLVCATLYYLMFTHDGSRRLYYLTQRVVPGELQVDILHGRLAGPLELTGLVYRQDDGLRIESERIYLDWRPSRLLGLGLDIVELTLEETRVDLPAGEPDRKDPPGQPFQGVTLPLAVSVSKFSSHGFELSQGEGAEPIRIDSLNLAAATEGDRLLLSQFQLAGFSSELSLQGSIGLDAQLPMALDLAWKHALPEGPSLAGQGRLRGDLRQLTLTQQLASPMQGELEALLSDLQDEPEWRAELKLQQGELAAINPTFPARLAGRLHASGSFEVVALEANLQLEESRLGEMVAELRGDYNQGAIQIEGLRISNRDGLALNATGSYLPKDGELSADLKWQGLRWPLIGEAPQISSDEGSLQLQGRLDAYRYELAMQASRLEVGALQLDAAGSGTLQQIDLQSLAVGLQQGKIEGSGKLAWSPALSWQLGLSGEGVDPALVHPMFPGDLGFDLVTRGGMVADELQAIFQLRDLSGSLRDYPVHGQGELSLKQGDLKIQSLQLITGKNRVAVDGTVGDRLAMNWLVDAPELASFWPGLSGKLQAEGDLGGTLQAPTLKAEIEAGELGLAGYRVGRLQGDMELQMAAEQRLALALHSKDISGFGKQWRSLDMSVQGDIPAHRLQIDLVGDDVPQLSLAAVSGVDEERVWQGQLRQLKLSAPEAGEWQLESAMAFRLGIDEQDLKPLCLVSGEARVCASYSGQNGGWQSKIAASQLPLSLLQPLLPDTTRIAGAVDMDAEFKEVAGVGIGGGAELTIPQGGLDFPLGAVKEQVDFSGSQATVSIDPEGMRADLALPLQQLGGFNLSLGLPKIDLADLDLDGQILYGTLKGGIKDLSMLTALSPQLQNSQGELSVDMTLGGKLRAPSVHGDAKLSRGAVDIPVLGIELRDIGLRLQSPDLKTLSLEGSVRSGEGRLSLQGTTRMDAENGFPSTIKIKGDEWLVVNTPEAEVLLSPDLSLEHSAQKSVLKGKIHLPYARIRPRTLPETAVSGSSDLVIVGDTDKQQAQPDTPLHAEIRLSLGKRVSFDGFGLRGKFTGGLMIIDEPGRPVVGRGRLGISDGIYQAYGQDLKIERGFALFADSPVDNPGLDVRAVREIDEIKAGMRISGTMKKPKLKLFSSPSMSESDILSYIVTGRPTGESSGKTAGMLAVLQATGASSVATELGRQLGLEELRVETGSTLEEAALVAGTYLSPRLYVQYVNELATSETKVRMRYDLTDRWQLEAETGRTQSGDFFYTFDR